MGMERRLERVAMRLERALERLNYEEYLRHAISWKRQLIVNFIGGLGNLYDRVARGYVVDFIELLFVRFAIFNAADIAVVAGAICLGIGILTSEGKST